MGKSGFSKSISALIFALSVFLGASPSPVLAQDVAGLTIIPPKFELFANPGDVINESIRITNRSNNPQTYSVIVEDFRSTGEEGQIVLEESNMEQYSLRSWIRLSAEGIVLQPGEEVVYPFSIVIPKNAEPGGHYASVLFQIGGPENIPGVTSVRSRIGALILLRTSGNVVEDVTIESFSTPSNYLTKGPVNFELRLNNNGTTHARPTGTIVMTNLFGSKVAEIPLNGLNVFPGAIRKMDTVWEKDSLFGIYTATLVATYGQQSLPLTASTKFTVAAPVSLAILAIALLALYVFITSLIKGRGRVFRALKMIFTGK